MWYESLCFGPEMCEEDMAKLSFFEVVTTDFTVDTPVEAFPGGLNWPSLQSQSSHVWETLRREQWSENGTVKPSSSSKIALKSQSFWIREEENCEEKSSMFNNLDAFVPQLNHVTKGRAKAPRNHRRGNNAKPITESKTEVLIQERPAGHVTTVLADIDTARLHRSPIIKDPKDNTTTPRRPGNNIKDLRAIFERMSS